MRARYKRHTHAAAASADSQTGKRTQGAATSASASAIPSHTVLRRLMAGGMNRVALLMTFAEIQTRPAFPGSVRVGVAAGHRQFDAGRIAGGQCVLVYSWVQNGVLFVIDA